ncbi:hypothetical protein BD408DRAFT_427026 [Parasitella parasitica]|nr:hypothetical protein BD408DRAFT_427026 [Parasitella parasitica]
MRGNRVIPSSLAGTGIRKITTNLIILYPPSGPEKTLMLMLLFLLDIKITAKTRQPKITTLIFSWWHVGLEPQLARFILRSNLCPGRVLKTSSLHYTSS